MKAYYVLSLILAVAQTSIKQVVPAKPEQEVIYMCGNAPCNDDSGDEREQQVAPLVQAAPSVVTVSAMLASKDTLAVKLSDEEYASLQKLRQAVIDEEKRLAVKYGAVTEAYCIGSAVAYQPITYCYPADHFEFHQ